MESAGQYDYIIIGGGTAGCVLANRLSQDQGKQVLLLEAGGKDDYVWIHIPVGYLYCINNPRTDWMFRTEAEAGLNGRSLIYPRGKVLGGCSSINGMIYMRGQAQDYDAWAALIGDPSWRWQQVLPLFKKSENHYRGANEFHGGGGEWRVARQRLSWEILDAFRAAAAESGIPPSADFNRGDNEGCGYFDVNQRRGLRWNAAQAFLKPAAKRPNLTIMSGCQVQRLRLSQGQQGWRCAGVEFIGGGRSWCAEAASETILAAGAIGSPAILQQSGIGEGAHLQQAGVALLHALPGVGANLQDHLQIRSVYKIRGARTLNQMAHSWLGKARIGLEYALLRRGPMSMAPSQLGAFTRSDPGQDRPNLEFHVQPLSLEKFGDPLHAFPAFTASVCNLRPTSRGSVRIASPDPLAAPKIAPNYLSTAEDRSIAAASLRLTRRIAAAPALQKYAPQELKPGVMFQSEAELAQAAGAIASTIFHPVGTCKMGRADDAMAVVDSQLRVRGIAGLRVADASIMPAITSGNTNAPTIMIAEKAALSILTGK
ncbi:MAG: GMC family oxidoreductase N-terminal domain-containing protein [Burkholderiales bacterium]|nr:GMC family oxidoreductase N-terminal domain-containing protein [Burkholderiales bacterium]